MRYQAILESAVVGRIVAALKKCPGIVVRKRHGTVMGMAGDPDLYGTINGRHFEIEEAAQLICVAVHQAPDERLLAEDRRRHYWRRAICPGGAHDPGLGAAGAARVDLHRLSRVPMAGRRTTGSLSGLRAYPLRIRGGMHEVTPAPAVKRKTVHVFNAGEFALALSVCRYLKHNGVDAVMDHEDAKVCN